MLNPVLSVLLSPVSLIYAGVTFLRNKFYDWHWLKSYEPQVFSLVVGNLSVGGTGKTPHVEFLVEKFANRYRTAIVSRGYGRKTKGLVLGGAASSPQEVGDELCQYLLKFQDKVLVIACEKRAHALQYIEKHHPEIELVILDDAFQHRALKAHAYVMLSDFRRLFCSDFVMPSGWLREGRKGAKRAAVVVVSKCPANLSPKERTKIKANIARYSAADVLFSTFRHEEAYWLNTTQQQVSWHGKKTILVTGIAKPDYLVEKIKKDAQLLATFLFADHHDFKASDFIKIEELLKTEPDAIVLTTEKDAVKIKSLGLNHLPLAVLPIKVQFLEESGTVLEEWVKEKINTFYGKKA